MTALINDRSTPQLAVKSIGLPVAVGTPICFKGARACIDTATGLCVQGKPSTTLVPVGLFAERVDNRTGAQTVFAQVSLDREILLRWYANDGTVTAASLLQDCYILDDQTVTMNPTGASKSGRIWQVDSVKGVAVETGAASSGNGAAAGGASLTQANWYVDEANVTGLASNANSGLTAGSPVLNWAEVLRRFGVGGTVSNGTNLVTVHYLSVPATPDAFRFDWPPTVTLGANMSVSVEAPAGTAVRTGTLTAATALVKTYGSAALATITDTGQVWTANQRVTITAGARAGQSFWVVTGGTGTASITPCATAYDIAASTITNTTPVAGDAYLLESNALPTIDIADLNIHYADRAVGNKAFVFRGFTIAGGSLSTHSGQALVIFDRCVVSAVIQNLDVVTFTNCWVTGTIIALAGMGLSFVAGYDASFTIARAGSTLLYAQDVVMGGGIGANVSPGTLVALDGVGFFCAGDGVTVGPGCTFQVGNFGSVFGAGGLYGAVAGTGVNVKEGGRLLYKNGQLPAIKGTTADWQLPNAPAYFDATGRTFPLATAGTPNTWANLAAAQPGGFASGCAHDPDTDAHILKVA